MLSSAPSLSNSDAHQRLEADRTFRPALTTASLPLEDIGRIATDVMKRFTSLLLPLWLSVPGILPTSTNIPLPSPTVPEKADGN
ncbi:hypothetical protein [Arthrobacter dokdonensis]|uniref:hypothetical protein n=1 Tax=Arthrobacter dokdonellae TaxID=2211210 RepID=UPI001013C56B|nr:hypothetical protein [Arthrobacter dokdonellae]